MQLGDSSVLETSSHNKPVMAAAAPPEAAANEGINGGEMEVDGNSGEEKGGEGGGDTSDKISFGGNRWPRQETLALLKIRLDMDSVFRDSSLKGPLWEEVSRKLAELGYHRSAKKCKEKFENVYKYHKRTKESRSGKSEGKTYKFFDQLEALQNQFTVSNYPPKPTTTTTNTVTLPTTRPSDSSTAISYVTTFPSTNPTIISPSPHTNTTNNNTTTTTTTTSNNPRNPSSQGNNNNNVSYSLPNMNIFSTTTSSTSSSTASDEDLEERYRRKRKWKDYFRRLTRKVLAKQEEMQKKFLEAIDKRERERVARQETWRMQEMARINREHEILVQERSTAAAKDAAVLAFLQNLSGQQNPTLSGIFHQIPPPPQPAPPPIPPSQVSQVESQQQQQPQPQSQPQPPALAPNMNFEIQRMNNGHSASATLRSSSSRWPKAEVHALIRLRTNLEAKYQDNGPKAPMWEDISAGMRSLGYNRSAKRCKQKWENINKYFKKVKESKKQRREDSKTCPYYHQLESLYKERSKNQNPFGASFENMKPNEMMEPLMVQPEQQWRPPPQYELEPSEEDTAKENNASQYQEKEEEDDDNDDDEDEAEGDDVEEEDGDSVADEGACRYEISTNKLSSVDTVE